MKFRDLELKIAAGTATVEDFEGFDPADVARIKSELPVLYRGAVQLAVPKPEDIAAITVPSDPTERVIELAANVQLVDRMGDLILSNPADALKYQGEGWQTDNWFSAGAPYLWSHNPDHPAVGRGTSVRVAKIDAMVQGEGIKRAWALLVNVLFFADDRFGELAVPAYMLTRAGITASSVGFLGKLRVRIEDEKERAKIGLGPWGMLFATCELLELSKAQVPANAWSVEPGQMAGGKSTEVAADAALKRWVAEGKLAETLASDFRKRFPLGPKDASERLAARVRSFADVAAERRGRPCQGLECLAEDAPASAKADCGCGAAQTKAAAAADRATLDRVRSLLAVPAGDDVVSALQARLKEVDDAVPDRSMRRIRKALDRASEAVEELALVVDDGAEDEAAENSSGKAVQLAFNAATFARDLETVRADPVLLGAVAPILRLLVEKSSGGASGAAEPPVQRAPGAGKTPGDASPDARLAIGRLAESAKALAAAVGSGG